MIDCTCFKGKRFGVLGLGKSGAAALKALNLSGVDVFGWDDKDANRIGIHSDLLVDLYSYNMSELDYLVLSPGISHTLPTSHPVVVRAREAGSVIINDVSLFKEAYKGDVIAITGTNGKSTTTALATHVLGKSMICQMGGNIGTPVMCLDQSSSVAVVELSSYQTEVVSDLSARGLVWLNITPDHIDRHGDMDGYVQAKKRIFETLNKNDVAVICVDDAYSQKVFDEVHNDGVWTCLPVSTKHKLENGVSIINGEIFDKGVCVGSMHNAHRLKGEHNHQNAACVYAIAKYIYHCGLETILDGFNSFDGLAHRQFHVGTIGNVDYINDSKATNAEASEQALKSYDNIYWLAGGVAKDGGIDGLSSCFPRVKKAYLYGACATNFAQTLRKAQCDYQVFDCLEDALIQAHIDAQASEECSTVLLSPACASFDQYPNFEIRGESFTKTVQSFD
jgi:UDP-N-acetylmuramoylalanine--D-glutamate ligase